MRNEIKHHVVRIVETLAIAALLSAASAMAQTEMVLHAFTGGSDGAGPFSGVVFDSAGNLHGTTAAGGSTTACGGFGCGALYELSPTAGGGWQEAIQFHFTNSKSGGEPAGNLFFDTQGNIFGANLLGGTNVDDCSGGDGGLFGCGLVFELSPDSGGYQESVPLALNSATMGEFPFGGVTGDAAGNLYGTTWEGGNLDDCEGYGCGIVFELSPTESGWQKKTLHTFTGGADGSGPRSSLILDSAGNVYGTTESGGNVACSCGCCFRTFARLKRRVEGDNSAHFQWPRR